MHIINYNFIPRLEITSECPHATDKYIYGYLLCCTHIYLFLHIYIERGGRKKGLYIYN